jgi:hypothetical protein
MPSHPDQHLLTTGIAQEHRWTLALFDLLGSQAEKYCSLICYERKHCSFAKKVWLINSGRNGKKKNGYLWVFVVTQPHY